MDPKWVVCDEYIGQSIALLYCSQKIEEYIISFIFFRFLDIKKPIPINYFDRLKNVSGVILDDIVAGSMVALIFYIYHVI